MDRRRKLFNFHEVVTRKILGVAAGRNCAEVFSKVRVADVLSLDGSGIGRDLYS
jgi:hypothetical protein